MGEVSARVLNLERLIAKISALPDSVKSRVLAANKTSAREFLSSVAQIAPVGDDEKREGEHLVTTLAMGDAKSPTAVAVSIGGPEAPYPLHLEVGYMTKGGKHVHGRAFWYPTWRLNKKRYRQRAARALNAAMKKIANGGA